MFQVNEEMGQITKSSTPLVTMLILYQTNIPTRPNSKRLQTKTEKSL